MKMVYEEDAGKDRFMKVIEDSKKRGRWKEVRDRGEDR